MSVALLLVLPTLLTVALAVLWVRIHRPRRSTLTTSHYHGMARGQILRLSPTKRGGRFCVTESTATTVAIVRVLP